MPDRKTPGVFIVEKNAFPNSVVEVATAVPAFIGYTERASNRGKDLSNVPFRITSMTEYLAYFGDPPRPAFTVEALDAPDTAPASPAARPTDARGQVADVTHDGRTYRLRRAAGTAGGRFLMHLAMRHFFDNGGGACYVVSVGRHDNEISADALIGGLEPLLHEQEPTIVVTPDAVLLDQPSCARVQQQVLAHCGGMGNRVAILDVWGGDRGPADPIWHWDPIA
ncbi:MAG: phage tail sheath family protein, partial [Burkholderiaceae bacterium]